MSLVERILGIDPGSRFLGYGVIHKQGNSLSYVDAGRLVLGDGPLVQRLVAIDAFLTDYLQKYPVQSVSIEGIFHQKNAESALKLGHARGVAILACARLGLEIFEYAPTLVKKSVASYGRADKAQLAAMVRMILGVKHKWSQDASDALALAICHANRSRVLEPRAI